MILRSLQFSLAVLLSSILSCHIDALIQFEMNPAEGGSAQFTFYNGSKSAMFSWRPGEFRREEHVSIDGPWCFGAPTYLTTFGATGLRKAETSAFLEGIGFIEYDIGWGGHPYVTTRIGVFCAFGNCGRG